MFFLDSPQPYCYIKTIPNLVPCKSYYIKEVRNNQRKMTDIRIGIIGITKKEERDTL